MALAQCCQDTVYAIAKELREHDARNPSKPVAPSQPAADSKLSAKAVRADVKDVHEDKAEDKAEEKPQEKPQATTKSPAGRRSAEKAERDAQIAALLKEGCAAVEIARRLNVCASTVSQSLARQKLTREAMNPLVNVLERAQLAASEWEQISSLLRDGNGAAASWPTATHEQKKEVTKFVNEAIRFQKEFINRLNKEAKG